MNSIYLKFEMGFLRVSTENGRLTEVTYAGMYHQKKEEKDDELLKEIEKDFSQYFRGINIDFRKYPLSFDGFTDFQIAVYRAAQKIPYGKIQSYKQIAEKIGVPLAYRAVGNALKKNPFLIVVPCHRVWKSNGTIGNFSAAIELKRYLCNIEGIRF